MKLECRDVAYTYSANTSFQVRALSGIDAAVDRGGLLLVLGVAGSGKSTLLKVLAGLLRPTSGIVCIDGVPVTDPVMTLGKVGLVFQSPHTQLFAETVEEDVAFGPRNLGAGAEEAREMAARALEAVDLDWDRFAKRSPFALSGGEAHRVAIAGVLAMSPAIMLFDEPTAGLDANGRAAMRTIIDEVRWRAGVVVVSHDIEEFLSIADEVLILKGGSVSYRGPARALIDTPSLFAAAGISPPEVVRAQILARDEGFSLGDVTLDPVEAARLVALARRARR